MPIEQDAFYSLLGIAQRAGALTFGQDGVLKAISTGAAQFVLLDDGASDNTKKKISDSCRHYGVELFLTQADRLGFSVGKPGRMCAAVCAGTLGERLNILAKQSAPES